MMTVKTKIFVILAFIASAGLGLDLFLGIVNKTYDSKVIAVKVIIIGAFLYYAVKSILNKNPKIPRN
jgi:hypothetical protein